jgi:hypothetical protein
MENSNKKSIENLAKILYDNNIRITNYDYDSAMWVFTKIKASEQVIELFQKESFHVFVEIMRLETVDSMHNLFKPI